MKTIPFIVYFRKILNSFDTNGLLAMSAAKPNTFWKKIEEMLLE
jgi:hypothetical protein